MPASYQAPSRKDLEKSKTVSQSVDTNTKKSIGTVQQILATKKGEVFSIAPDDTISSAVSMLKERRVGALLVVSGGALVGILSERDIVRKLAETPGQTLPQKVSENMTDKVEVCSPEDDLVNVLRRMTVGRFRHMPVLDGVKLVGMVTIGDVISHRLNELEHEALQLKQMIVG